MDLKNALIESGSTRQRRNWKGVGTSLLAHGIALAGVLIASFGASGDIAAEEKPIPVYVQQASAPPPPPPPPPPAAGSSSPAPQEPNPVVQPEPVQIPPDNFVAPTEEPEDLPDVVPTTTPSETPLAPSSSLGNFTPTAPTAQPGGVPGGVAGGVEGGEIGGVIGGQIGGVVGGVVGGTVGGQLGGQVGGTGTSPAPAPEPALPTGPVRVGGNVKAPTITSRPEPEYTELARRSRVTGVVVLEAVIDKHGNVDRVKVIKGLPMGLSESAAAAVRRWKFKPGTMGGKPIDVIFNLTVNFRLGADSPGMKVRSAAPVKPEPEPEPAPAPQPEPDPPSEAPAEPPSTSEGG